MPCNRLYSFVARLVGAIGTYLHSVPRGSKIPAEIPRCSVTLWLCVVRLVRSLDNERSASFPGLCRLKCVQGHVTLELPSSPGPGCVAEAGRLLAFLGGAVRDNGGLGPGLPVIDGYVNADDGATTT